MTSHELKIRIMRRVYVIYYVRRALSPRALKMYAFVAACLGTASVVSVSNVFANMPGDFAGIGTFLVAAFANTQFVVQALSLAALVTLGVLVTDIVRSFAAMPRVSRV
ncbi:hypothetical protein A3D66_00275 [Candidatus Kaiserbacteria bacterium RIFCSPHIGHO2_02_FULL_50_9]|uniref:Uncharacterized protein n=1 Tax=Candidatus Kaiserbacteria bacterium RIFCSPLOWO2_01_FULL_51_21 TaxID=1798508 RepID=A0A1F6ECE4_9BACT|nr:MAG: hypothetical protein A2761_00360 [Candidatus Kaiserbacteria bacterium RIFCSPHIGHO2_01_FULL_51_33]OGG63530.1 MAG: hypothetical protein A3D66_00275 [Candidatus Kaiserbacteria bacterium RIFCSPHIGHO2_02_FULL_50_9]OGG71355.1 MAG: hypothetical protein A3A35_00090 [Candidatus Kaiserbacteria bacterium RIFCSPLOWO2_01_FULL_51_21]